MIVFVAGATGAIGRPLIAELVRRGHAVTGMTRSEAGTRGLKELGTEVALVDALDAAYLVTRTRNLPIPPSLFTFVGLFSSCATRVPR